MQADARDPVEAAGAGDGGLAWPRGRKNGNTGWTANNTVQGWTVNEIPSGVGQFSAVGLGIGGSDSFERKCNEKEFLRNTPAETIFLQSLPFPPTPSSSPPHPRLPARSRRRGGGGGESRRVNG